MSSSVSYVMLLHSYEENIVCDDRKGVLALRFQLTSNLITGSHLR